MGAPITITKEQMAEGFAKGRALIQEEWAHPQEIKWVDELIVEGKATATPWEYKGNFQCERRRVTGNAAIRALAQPAVGRDGTTSSSFPSKLTTGDRSDGASDGHIENAR